jgi:hypothetical protein
MTATLRILSAAGLVLIFLAPASAQNTLSTDIDRLVRAQLDAAKIPPSPRADDAEFLRRVYLDITGRIPTYEQSTTFLASTDPAKRAKLIDELLSRPEYGLHFATLWRDRIVDRAPDNNQARQGFSWEFITWMAEAFNKDHGWDAIVRDILTAEGDAKKNPTTTFILANRMNGFPRPADLTSTTGRLFMGIQLRCAQCHDHPYVDDWKQDDFWGVAAFFGQLRDHNVASDGTTREPVFYDKPITDAKKETQYVNRLKRVGFLAPVEGAKIAIPNSSDPTKVERVVAAKFFLGDKAELKTDDPARARFAAWLTSTSNAYFARSFANRLWSHFFATGLANPVDAMRPDMPTKHAALLDLLEKEFKKSGFQQKHLIRAICNSETYQRTSRPLKDNAQDRELFSHMQIKLLNPDQMIDAIAIAAGRPPTVGKNREQQNAPFVTADADADPTQFTHGIPQFLLLMNGNSSSNPQNLGKLTTGKKKDEAIQAIFHAVLSRPARPAEMERMLAHVEKAENANQGYRDIYWVLLNSAEFVLSR